MSEEKGSNYIFESFCGYLSQEIKDKKAIEKILEKGEKIIKKFDKMLEKENKKFLLVGKVQSGKTINFLSVIAYAFKAAYKIIIVFTSIENKLHKQTTERIKKAFDYKNNGNFLRIYDFIDTISKYSWFSKDDSHKQVEQRISHDDGFVLFTLLKKPEPMKHITKFLKSHFMGEKILIIDDEGDLASMSKQSKGEDRKTKYSIQDLINALKQPSYLTVTATPYVHFLTNLRDEMVPKKFFCVEPGKDYHGLEIFTNDHFYEIVKKDTNEIDKALSYYIISWANLLMEDEIQDWKRSHSNFLIHTNVKTAEHEKIEKYISRRLEKMKKGLDDDEYKKSIYSHFERIIEHHKIKNYFDTHKKNDYEEKLEYIVKRMEIMVVNQKNPNDINSNISNILIGSKMLERGITLDNLIAVFLPIGLINRK